MNKKIFIFLIVIFCLGCNFKTKKNELIVGFTPSEKVEEIRKKSQPLVELMSQYLNIKVKPFVSIDYSGIIQGLRSGQIDVAFLSPAAYVIAKQESDVKVILKALRNNKSYYYSAIITRVDSGINSINNLKGKTFSFGDSISTTGHIFPRKILLENGINPEKDLKNVIFSGSHDAVVMSVLDKKVDAGATYCDSTDGKSGPWNKLPQRDIKLIKVIAYSPKIPSDNICVNKDIDSKMVKKIEEMFLKFTIDTQSKKLLSEIYNIDGFEKATDEEYKIVRQAFESAGINLIGKLTTSF